MGFEVVVYDLGTPKPNTIAAHSRFPRCCRLTRSLTSHSSDAS